MATSLKTPPLRLLRAFCLAARHSSFKLAADRLALTPSAVSHQVKELEEQLGVVLFERRTRAVVLTPVGRQLLEDLEPALEAVAAAVARTARAGSARRQLTVVMPPFFASELFAPRLPEFNERHPDIDLQVHTSDPRPGQHSGYSDLSVILATDEPDGAELDAVRLLPLRLVPVASPKVAASMQGKPRARAFDQQTLILHRSFRSGVWNDWLIKAGIDLGRLKNMVEFDNMTAVARATERGAGIALMPELVCRPWFERGALARIDGFDYPDDESYYLVMRHA
ncbi:MAG TPA: LysR substrate-binding domain-containing protein, partial [Steroidobacteraceae bacterium]|nr:LysR substrate-binding domain-containing protein [Steroidobacteraceae bacterium]